MVEDPAPGEELSSKKESGKFEEGGKDAGAGKWARFLESTAPSISIKGLYPMYETPSKLESFKRSIFVLPSPKFPRVPSRNTCCHLSSQFVR